jgi:hypothetical protein
VIHLQQCVSFLPCSLNKQLRLKYELTDVDSLGSGWILSPRGRRCRTADFLGRLAYLLPAYALHIMANLLMLTGALMARPALGVKEREMTGPTVARRLHFMRLIFARAPLSDDVDKTVSTLRAPQPVLVPHFLLDNLKQLPPDNAMDNCSGPTPQE